MPDSARKGFCNFKHLLPNETTPTKAPVRPKRDLAEVIPENPFWAELWDQMRADFDLTGGNTGVCRPYDFFQAVGMSILSAANEGLITPAYEAFQLIWQRIRIAIIRMKAHE